MKKHPTSVFLLALVLSSGNFPGHAAEGDADPLQPRFGNQRVGRVKKQIPSSTKSDFTSLVNPLIDSNKSRFDFFASATLPYGMVALSPDTRHGTIWNSGYLYDDGYILNFSHIHNIQTAGIPVMPVTGPCKGNLGIEASKSRFSHEREIVKPGYHKVVLENYEITAELTATCRVGMHRYTFPAAPRTRGHSPRGKFCCMG